ncbi:MAG: DUF948 domain-containing protein [Cumulibacter sp.]
MSGGEIAALIAAGAFLLLVLLLAVPILKLGRTLDETTLAVRIAHEGATPLLQNAVDTVKHVNTNLGRVDGITANAENISQNAAAVTSLVSSTIGSPLVKVASFTYGVRKATAKRSGRN